MPCFSPLHGWRSNTINPRTGKRAIVFDAKQAFRDLHVTVPCGRCIGCRLEHSRQWAIRATHEAALYDKNCFITLTYAPEHLPALGSIDPEAPVLFMKRLRKKFGSGIRSYGCAEYGENFGRPHYHICLFNFDFPDKKLWKEMGPNKLYTSEDLQALWPFGFSSIGSLTFESAAYVARYVTKKFTGKLANNHYQVLSPEGEILGLRHPEKPVCVSRNPGLGAPWLKKFKTDVYPSDSVVLRGKEMKPPKYYDRQYELENPSEFATLTKQRKMKFNKVKICRCYMVSILCICTQPNAETQRLLARATCASAKLAQSKRKLENDT